MQTAIYVGIKGSTYQIEAVSEKRHTHYFYHSRPHNQHCNPALRDRAWGLYLPRIQFFKVNRCNISTYAGRTFRTKSVEKGNQINDNQQHGRMGQNQETG